MLFTICGLGSVWRTVGTSLVEGVGVKYIQKLRSLYRRPYEAAGSLDRPPWNVVKRCWMASATNTRGGPTPGRSFASDRQGGLEESCRSRNGSRLEHIKTLEKIQKRALKCCRNNSPLKWDTLTDRRTRIRLCAMFKTYREYIRVLVERPEGKRPLGRPRRRWEDNIKMDLREVGYDGRDWINLAQDRGEKFAPAPGIKPGSLVLRTILRPIVHITVESRPPSHSVECVPCIMAVDLIYVNIYVELEVRPQKRKTLEERGSFRCCGLNFGVAQWLEDLVRRTKDPDLSSVELADKTAKEAATEDGLEVAYNRKPKFAIVTEIEEEGFNEWENDWPDCINHLILDQRLN
ncbi:hypothetical protein ANN_12619 [Periplaneta americana]|uniref:Uncharacterized protein n=1 Tax=Periplaneta americana TaxID=6978 RepID=A0ABQ8TH14_PERAM|nr:hypothetical protein ANN_12619 [Periplaneta americana]